MAWKVLKKLDEQELTLYVERDGKLMYASDRNGLQPLLRGVTEYPEAFEGSHAADRVVGLAAAYLLVHGKVEEIEAKLITEEAIAFLEEQEVKVKYQKTIKELVQGRQKEPDPMEELARKSGGVVLFVDELSRVIVG